MKTRDSQRDGLDVAGAELALRVQSVEGGIWRELTHLDRVLERFARAIDVGMLRRASDRNHAEINVWR